jgi:DNA-binding GntR family transcriptional regulator
VVHHPARPHNLQRGIEIVLMVTNLNSLQTRKDLVAVAIRDSILRGRFKPGEKLDQQQIGDELEVSRSPVREALRALDAEGLITLIPNRGAIVTERSLAELEELYFTRSLIEGIAIERSAPKMDSKTLYKLEGILDAADRTDDYGELLGLNNEFHLLTYSKHEQPFIIDYIQQLRNMAAPYNRLYLDSAGNREAAWKDHQRIYNACIRKDGTRARKELERHLKNVIQKIVVSDLEPRPRVEETD